MDTITSSDTGQMPWRTRPPPLSRRAKILQKCYRRQTSSGQSAQREEQYFHNSLGTELKKKVASNENGGIAMSRLKRADLQIQQLIRFGSIAVAILFAGIILTTGTTLRADDHHSLANTSLTR